MYVCILCVFVCVCMCIYMYLCVCLCVCVCMYLMYVWYSLRVEQTWRRRRTTRHTYTHIHKGADCSKEAPQAILQCVIVVVKWARTSSIQHQHHGWWRGSRWRTTRGWRWGNHFLYFHSYLLWYFIVINNSFYMVPLTYFSNSSSSSMLPVSRHFRYQIITVS